MQPVPFELRLSREEETHPVCSGRGLASTVKANTVLGVSGRQQRGVSGANRAILACATTISRGNGKENEAADASQRILETHPILQHQPFSDKS